MSESESSAIAGMPPPVARLQRALDEGTIQVRHQGDDGFGVLHRRDVDACSHDVSQFSAHGEHGRLNLRHRIFELGMAIAGGENAAGVVSPDRACDEDEVAGANGPAVADLRFPAGA